MRVLLSTYGSRGHQTDVGLAAQLQPSTNIGVHSLRRMGHGVR